MLCSVLLLVGCGTRRTPPVSMPATSYTDDLGRSLSFATPPRRIISLAPSLTETLFALGAGDRVVGVTRFCTAPPEATTRTQVGDMVQPQVETIASLNPDLVVLSVEGNTHRTFLALERMGMPLFVSNPRSLDGILHSIRVLGKVIGEERRGKELADSLRREMAALRGRHEGRAPSCLMLVSSRPLMVAGAGSFLGEMVEWLGAKNAARDLPGAWPVLNRETMLTLNPDLLLVPGDLHVNRAQLESQFPEWHGLRCMRGEGPVMVDADVFLRPGPRVLQALHDLDRILGSRVSPRP